MITIDPAARRRLVTAVARRAACPDSDADFFPEPWEDAEPARAVCARCPVRRACLALAVARPEPYGVWGGATELERDQVRRAMLGSARRRAARAGAR